MDAPQRGDVAVQSGRALIRHGRHDGRQHGLELGLGLGQLGVGVAVGHDAAAGEQPGRRRPSISAQRMPTAHVPLPSASTQPTGAAVAAALEALDARRSARAPSSRGWPPSAGVGERGRTSSSTSAPARQAALDGGAEVLHVGHRDDRRLGLPVEVGAPGQQRVVDHVDRRRGARPGPSSTAISSAASRASVVGSPVRGAVPASGWERTHVAVAGHEQLGAGADEAVDRVAVARPERRPQPEQDGVHVERLVAPRRPRRGRSPPSSAGRPGPRRARRAPPPGTSRPGRAGLRR